MTKPECPIKPEARMTKFFGFLISDFIGHSDFGFRILVKSRKGFTLVELIVVIALVGLITTVSLANFRAGERSLVLRGASDEFASLVRRAEARALASNLVGDALEPPLAYGVILKTNRLATLFADSDGDGMEDTDVEELEFSDVITAARVGDKVTFNVPRGEVKLNGSCLSGSSTLTFSLKHTTTGDIKQVKINCISGRITIE